MNLELTLLELNQLYYATSKLVEQNESHLKELGKNISSIEYFTNELNKSVVLRDKIQTALYDEAKKLDEAIEYVNKFKAEQYDRERDILKNAIDEEVEPEYDSAGFTEDDRIVNGQYRNLDSIAEQREDAKYERAFSHFVSNEDADEDAKQRDYSAFNNYADTIKQDEQRYNNKKLFTLNKNR
jgi:hypothetical protein